MTALERASKLAAVVPVSHHRVPGWLRPLSVPVVVLTVVAGVWLTGAVLTDDATVAMVLTGAWFALAGLVALWVALRWWQLALPVLATFVLTAGGVGGYLLVTSTVDRTVDEKVVTAGPAPSRTAGEARRPGAALLASGKFRSGAHETSGTASLIERPGGARVLTLTGFATDPGPDLRVYLVPGDGSSVRGHRDIGALKGNKGDQQYAVPRGAPAGAVVVWCRAFSVSFGAATLD